MKGIVCNSRMLRTHAAISRFVRKVVMILLRLFIETEVVGSHSCLYLSQSMCKHVSIPSRYMFLVVGFEFPMLGPSRAMHVTCFAQVFMVPSAGKIFTTGYMRQGNLFGETGCIIASQLPAQLHLRLIRRVPAMLLGCHCRLPASKDSKSGL